MELENIVTVLTNTGVSIAVIAYFMFRDYKFMTRLTENIQKLVDAICDTNERLKIFEERRE